MLLDYFHPLITSDAWRWTAVRTGVVRDVPFFVDYLHRYGRVRNFRCTGTISTRTTSTTPISALVSLLTRCSLYGYFHRIMLYAAVAYCLVCWLFQPTLPHFDNLLLHNFVHMEHFHRHYNLITVMAIAVLAVFLHPLVSGARDLGAMVSLWRHLLDRQSRNARLHVGTVLAVNTFHTLYYMIVIYVFSFDVRVIHHVVTVDCFESRLFASRTGYIVALVLIATPTVLVFFLRLIQVYVLLGTLGMLTLFAGKVLLEENHRFARYFLRADTIGRRNFRHFRERNVFALRALADINRTIGVGFFALLLLILPQNANLWNLLYFRELPKVATFRVTPTLMLLLCLAVWGVVILFALQLYICALIGWIHRPVRVLLPLPSNFCWTTGSCPKTTKRRRCNTKLLLSVAIYLQQFHTTNQYTMTYGRYGRLTYASIGGAATQYLKLLIFYFKFWSKH